MNTKFGKWMAMGAFLLAASTMAAPAMARTSDDNPPADAVADTSMTTILVKAYLDVNGNGKRDPGEPDADAYYKITGGGEWYVCDFAGAGDVRAIPVVRDNGYYILPVALPGYRVTTPVLNATFTDPDAVTVNQIGVIMDAKGTWQGCGDGLPARAIDGN